MMSDSIAFDHGLLFVHRKESRIDSAIHMFFMKFDTALIWINSEMEVVDTQLAKRWHPLYVPRKPARYFLETHVGQLDHFSLGDILKFEYD
jgi:uncharacterized membrane protein (UPF0127 family)